MSQTNSSFNLLKALRLTVKYWYLFVISLGIAWAYVQIQLRYAIPSYKYSAAVFIKDNKASGADSYLQGMELLKGGKNIFNEEQSIKSYELILKTINSLPFNVSYYTQGNVKKEEIYKKSPFIVNPDSNFNQTYGKQFFIINTSDSTYNITQISETWLSKLGLTEPEAIYVVSGQYGYPCISDRFYLTIEKNKTISFNPKVKYSFVLNRNEDVAKSYQYNLSTNQLSKFASILVLNTTGNCSAKEIDFLNRHCEIYIQAGLEEKNKIAINTINFIERYLTEITDSLQNAEGEMETFKSNDQYGNISDAASNIVKRLREFEEKNADQLVKEKYYMYLKSYIMQNYDVNSLAAPSSLGINDEQLSKMINEIYTLYTEQKSLSFSAKEKNPSYKALEIKINTTKAVLLENLNTLIESSKIIHEDIENRSRELRNQLSKLPNKEKKLINIQRRFSLNDNIYTYLMERKIEAGIAKASNIADNKIVTRASTVGQIAPNPKKIQSVALLIGLALPAIFIFIQIILNFKLDSKETLAKLTTAPILGVTLHNKSKSLLPVVTHPKSAFSESVRSLRVSLQYLVPDKHHKIIGITSSISGEGKTFFSVNLAASLAQTGKKVLLMGLDLRKPKIHDYLPSSLQSEYGLTDVLIHKKTWQEVLIKHEEASFDVIPAGHIPPNPMELLEQPIFAELIETLRDKYDFILMDGSPVGLVSDFYVPAKMTDVNIYITRHEYTHVKLIRDFEEENNKKKLYPVFVVYNDFSLAQNYGYGGYGYGYGGYGYYDEHEEKVSFFNKVLNRIRMLAK